MIHLRNELPFLEEIVSFNECKTIVEVGVARAESTVYLCNAAKRTGGFVYGFDIWEIHGLKNQFGRFCTRQQCIDTLRRKGFNNFELFKVDTFKERDKFEALIKEHCSQIDFCFIDGCHSYRGISHDFFTIYPYLKKTGIVAFHDTLRIDGCREFMIDLRSKYYDGTFDIVDFPYGQRGRRCGVSLLVKRCYHKIGISIDEICDMTDRTQDIENKEKEWFSTQENLAKPEPFIFQN